MGSITELPSSTSPSLCLTHPTSSERTQIWTLNSANWGTALGVNSYLERETYLTTVPLAKDGGVTHWILVDSNLPPNNRPILACCESLRKRALVAKNGTVTETVTHGIGSVFTDPKHRGKGYASRMLRELGTMLSNWQTSEKRSCDFSILYSDIGKKYYASHGWVPFPSKHIAFTPLKDNTPTNPNVKSLTSADLAPLCANDEQFLRRDIAAAAQDGKTHVALIPDLDTMQWHHLREDFMTLKLFGRVPTIKGALVGEAGSRVWAIWTRSFYGPLVEKSGNTLHILRLVVENEDDVQGNVEKLRSIVQVARREAAEWKLNEVEVWNVTPVQKALVEKIGDDWEEVDRKEESIASLMWYGEGSVEQVVWDANEKFGWC